MNIKAFFDETTYTLTYVVWDSDTKDALIIDPVLDYDPASSTTSEDSIGKVLSFLKENGLKPSMSLETHAHADHLSASQVLKTLFPGLVVAIGAQITEVQKVFKPFFDLEDSFATDGSQFDRLLNEGEIVHVGTLKFKTLYTPGHTPACASYLFENAVFTGDALFMPDYGVGRCDFPAGSAETLYHSVTEQLYTLPEETRVFTGHDYQPNGRTLRFESTIQEEKASNIHINQAISESEFVKFRTDRDKTLKAPKLLLPSVQVNIRAGQLPEPHANGVSYLTIPIRKSEA